MTRKDTERLVREKMQQSISDKDALWAKIEQRIPEKRPVPKNIPAPKPSRITVAYRVMAAAACLLLVVGSMKFLDAVHFSNHSKQDGLVMNGNFSDCAPAGDQAFEDAAEAAPEAEAEAAPDAEAADEAGSADDFPSAVRDAGNTKNAGTSGYAPKSDFPQYSAENAEAAASAPLPDAEEIADAARGYLIANSAATIETITNWDSPEITQITALPEHYFAAADTYDQDGMFWQVVFTTTQDALLGPQIVYLDRNGVVVGLGIRE